MRKSLENRDSDGDDGNEGSWHLLSAFGEKGTVLGVREMLSHLILANAFGRVGDDGHNDFNSNG